MCELVLALQMISALFAVSAAVCWYMVARIDTPPVLTRIDLGDDGFDGGIQQLFRSVALQGKWNKRAAICAIVAAVAQAILVKMPTCISM